MMMNRAVKILPEDTDVPTSRSHAGHHGSETGSSGTDCAHSRDTYTPLDGPEGFLGGAVSQVELES